MLICLAEIITMVLLPPSADAFESREALIVSTQQWASGQGHAVVIARSKAGKVYLQCDREGTYRNKKQLTNKTWRWRTGSQLTAYPFSAVGISHHGAWMLYVQDERHNHEASTTQSAHPILQRLDVSQRTQVTELSCAGVAPCTIATAMRNAGRSPPVLIQDIYNARINIRVKALAEQTPIQVLLAHQNEAKLHTET